LKAYVSLVRPRIMIMVLFAMTAAAWITADQRPGPRLLHALAGAAAVIAGAMALNQRLERAADAKMARTVDRPLPAGRLSDRQVTCFGLLATAAGLGWLAASTGPPVVALAAVSWLLYVCVYTPLKSITLWQTPIGAAAGAMPILLGAAAVGRPLSPLALSLFGVVFLWQFPHSMAVAWLYRRQFALADVKLATVVDPSGRTAGWLAVIPAAALLPVSMLPLAYTSAGLPYAACAAVLGAIYLGCAIGFLRHAEDTTARRLLRASLVYLPLLLAALLLAK
jgi:protoheme IX farnesyltransferase